jgi:hypothetical protein
MELVLFILGHKWRDEFIPHTRVCRDLMQESKFRPHRLAWLGRLLLRQKTPVQIRLGLPVFVPKFQATLKCFHF